jgi:hypothetical protein
MSFDVFKASQLGIIVLHLIGANVSNAFPLWLLNTANR